MSTNMGYFHLVKKLRAAVARHNLKWVNIWIIYCIPSAVIIFVGSVKENVNTQIHFISTSAVNKIHKWWQSI